MTINGRSFLITLAVTALLLQGTAFAQATFTSTGGKISATASYAGYLFVTWNESGLPPSSTTSYTITGSSTATYACTTEGTMCQTSASGDLLDFATNATANGTIRQTVAVAAPGPGYCTCFSGSLVLYNVSYGGSPAAPDLQICDDTNPGAGCAMIGAGYFSRTFCQLKNLQHCPPAS